MNALVDGRLSLLYPTARIRSRHITRLEERSLGWSVLDGATADEMGREQVGWFVEIHSSLAQVAEQFGRLDTNPEGGLWIVVPHSRKLACELFEAWPYKAYVSETPGLDNSVWRSRKVWVAIPEDLKRILELAQASTPGVAGVFVIDPLCLLYRARSGTDSWGNVHSNDRPQHVVNFRSALHVDGWLPPLFLLTNKPAKSVNTQVVARALCLNAFRFAAAGSFSCWDEPLEAEGKEGSG